MTSRKEREMVRKWLLNVAAGDDTEAAEPAVYALAWIAELARGDGRPKRKMIRIRAKGVDMLVEPPVSQSEVEVDQ